jgi:serine/threonine protein kinase
MSELVGKILASRYRILESIGHGGMADVYKIWDPRRATHLAMKVLHADLAEDMIFLRRFKREARTLAKLQHPNIVRIYGLEEDDNLAYILMDYIEGITLRTEIRRRGKPFPLERLLEIMRPVCAALHYAHQSGIVHCDIKPANIMIEASGRILVSDFGIARASEAATATLVGAGTPAYMAPELTRGENPTPQTDIYALGVILFEMLTGGERPFTGKQAGITGSTGEKVRWEQANQEPPSPRRYNRKIPPDLEFVVMQCLQKEPANRFASAQDLLNALTTLKEKKPAGMVSSQPSSGPRNAKKVRDPRQSPAANQPSPVSLRAPRRKYILYLMLGICTLLVTAAIVIALRNQGSEWGMLGGITNALKNQGQPSSQSEIAEMTDTASIAEGIPLLLDTPTWPWPATSAATETPSPTATLVPTWTPKPTVFESPTFTEIPPEGNSQSDGGFTTYHLASRDRP